VLENNINHVLMISPGYLQLKKYIFSKANKFQINPGSFQTPFSCTFYAIQLCVQGINV
jgi:hypothetical protein